MLIDRNLSTGALEGKWAGSVTRWFDRTRISKRSTIGTLKILDLEPKSTSTSPTNLNSTLATKKNKLELHYTCSKCSHRQTKRVSHDSYIKGVVLVRCDQCANIHLIADNLGWFQDDPYLIGTDDAVTKTHNSLDLL